MTYRPIDTADRPLVPATPGRVPQLKFLRVGDLVLDDDFQRPLARRNWTQIEEIAANFTWAHFTPLVTAPVDGGRYCIIDGQHRTHAAALCGIAEVPAMVVDLTVEQQARAFTAINGAVTAITPFHIYRAALTALEPWAIACDKVTADAGCRLMTAPPSAANRKPGEILSIQLIRKWVDAGKSPLVLAALTAMRNCKTWEAKPMWSAAFLEPWFRAIDENPRSLRRDLTFFLNQHPPVDLLRKVDALKASAKWGGHSRYAIMSTLLRALLNDWMGQKVAA